MWMTRGPFRQLTKSLCDFGDVTPHTLVDGAQTILTAMASARADRRDWPSEAWGPRDKIHTPPLGALDRRAGATGAVGMARKRLVTSEVTSAGKGLTGSIPYSDRRHRTLHIRQSGESRSPSRSLCVSFLSSLRNQVTFLTSLFSFFTPDRASPIYHL